MEITVKAVLFFASHLPEHESSKEAMGMLLSGNLKPFQKKSIRIAGTELKYEGAWIIKQYLVKK